jgi:hypothetical protein
MQPFSPAQFATRPAVAQVETELRRWLREAPIEQRVEFLEQLWPINPHFTLSLAHTSQLPMGSAVNLLEQWLQGNHNHASPIIEAFLPLLGGKRFWQVVSRVSLPPQMANMLEYYRRGA